MAETILVVDDSEAMLHAVSRLMAHAGYNVLKAATAKECLGMVSQHRPSLVLLDVQLPDLDGLEVLKRLKANPETRDTFVVHLSAERTDVESKAAGLEHGADGYISQPIDNRELVARVRAFIRHKNTIDELRASEARYRHLFENNPQPMWIVDPEEEKFMAINDSAVKHYGFTQEEFLKLSPASLVETQEVSEPGGVPALTAFDLHQQHRRKDGSVIDVEVSRHHMRWKDKEAIVLQIADVTAWKQVERERLQLLSKYERELKELERISGVRPEVSRTTPSKTSLEDTSAALALLQVDYEKLLQLALDQRIYKVDHLVSARLKGIADRLFDLRATPREVINLHCSSLKNLIPEPNIAIAQGYAEVGRLAIVELMGYVASAYRDFSLKIRN